MFKPRGRSKNNFFKNLPAPVSGINSTVGLMDMPESDAVLMENWFPKPDGLVTRNGFVSHVTGFAQQVDRLHSYAATTGGESLWATTSTGIYNATTAGAVGATVMVLTEGKTIAAQIATGAGSYLLLANGVDTMKQYDGTSWTSIATFGATATSVYSFVEVYRQRVFLAKKNSLEIEYLAVNSVAGAATNYPLGAIFRQGGYIVALGTWTIDGGFGPEDNLAIITNKGEVAVFAGNDPATWTQKGVYSVGRPLGANCLYKYGGDILILTENGLFPLSSAVQSTSIDRQKVITQKVRPILNSAAQAYFTNQGWQIISDPLLPYLIVNVPSTPLKKQLVMHAQTGAWTTFSGWDALCFARVTSELYFGTGNSVCRITGYSDNGANITSTMMQAYSRYGQSGNKMAQLIKAYLSTTGGFSYNLGMASSFQDPKEKSYFMGAPGLTAGVWGTAVFGSAMWTGATAINQDWQTIPDDYTAWKALYLQVISNNGQVVYTGSDMLLTPGGNF